MRDDVLRYGTKAGLSSPRSGCAHTLSQLLPLGVFLPIGAGFYAIGRRTRDRSS